MTNFADRTIWTGDNLDILHGLNSASVDLIYLDPPFNFNPTTRATANVLLPTTRTRRVNLKSGLCNNFSATLTALRRAPGNITEFRG